MYCFKCFEQVVVEFFSHRREKFGLVLVQYAFGCDGCSFEILFDPITCRFLSKTELIISRVQTRQIFNGNQLSDVSLLSYCYLLT